MSRAFTKEIDDAPPPSAPDRPVSAARNLVTPPGARRIERAIEALNRQLSEANDEPTLAALRRDLKYWQARSATMEIVDIQGEPDVVRFGTTVTVQRNGKIQELTIVGEDEADPQAGAIAWTSPLARAIDGAEAGEEIEFERPGGTESILVTGIRRRMPIGADTAL